MSTAILGGIIYPSYRFSIRVVLELGSGFGRPLPARLPEKFVVTYSSTSFVSSSVKFLARVDPCV
jgi:hypothetical protein